MPLNPTPSEVAHTLSRIRQTLRYANNYANSLNYLLWKLPNPVRNELLNQVGIRLENHIDIEDLAEVPAMSLARIVALWDASLQNTVDEMESPDTRKSLRKYFTPACNPATATGKETSRD